jgi:TonB-dependent receptor
MPVGNLLTPKTRFAISRRLIVTTSAAAIGLATFGSQAFGQTGANVAPSATDSSTSTVVVTGRRGLDASLTTKRDSVDQLSAISADEIADRPVANVVDALSILPGISTFADNGRGQATTGNPEYINIRGLPSSYNAFEVNGIRVPNSDATTRAVSLKDFAPSGIQSITVDTTPTAAQDGDSIAGIVNIITPTAFDFAKPLAKITLQGLWNDLANNTGEDGNGQGIEIDLAQKFGGDHFGVYVNGYFLRQGSAAETTEVSSYDQTYLNPTTTAQKDSLTADQVRWDYYTHAIKNYGGNISLDYRAQNQTLYFKANVSEYDDQAYDNQQSIRHQTGAPNYVNLNPIQSGPGQTNTNAYDANGVYDPNAVMPGHYFQLRDQLENLVTAKIGGTTDAGPLSLAYEASYGYAVERSPNYVEGSSYGLPLNAGSFIVNSTAGGIPSVSYNSPATQSYLFSQTSIGLWKTQGQDEGSEDSLYGGKIDADYHLDAGPLKVLHAGIDISQSKRIAFDHNFTDDNFEILTPQGYLAPYYAPAGAPEAAQAGQNVGSFLGYGGAFRVNYRGPYVALILPYKYTQQYANVPGGGTTVNGGTYNASDYNNGSYGGTEDIDAGYVSADLQWGQFHLYPGLRFEYAHENGYFWNYNAVTLPNGNTTGAFQTASGSSSEVLPVLMGVYRPDNGFVFRGEVRKSFSRPAFGLLYQPAGTSSTNGPDAITTISRGNPNLSPSESINTDFDVEYYGVKDLFLEAAVFNKQISKFIYTVNVEGGTPPDGSAPISANNNLIYSEPENGKSASVSGLELVATDRFSFLPGLWRGLGVNVNGTFTHSEADSGQSTGNTPLPQAPKLIYNLQLLYDLNGVHSALSYQYQGLQLYTLENNVYPDGFKLPNEYLQPTAFLNLTVGYTYHNWDVTFGARNLTNEYSFYKTIGESKQYLGQQDGGGNGAYINTGRFYQLQLSYKY